jgi:hypothetical protein
VGFLVFEFTDADEPLVTRIEYVEELTSDDLSVEEPDDEDLDEMEWDVADLDR